MAEKVSLNLPDFVTDKHFEEAQELSFTTGKDILSGKLPEFYSSLGQTGGKEFEDMLALINRDTTKAVQENLVRRNIARSGVGGSSIAKAVADATTKLTYTDFLKSAEEKQSLLGTGLETVSGVRGAGLEFGRQKNVYGMQGAGLQLEADKFNVGIEEREQAREDAKKAEKNKMWSSILEAGIGAASIMATGGATAPLVLGSAAAKAGKVGGVGGMGTEFTKDLDLSIFGGTK